MFIPLGKREELRRVVRGVIVYEVQSEYDRCCVSLVAITIEGVKPREDF